MVQEYINSDERNLDTLFLVPSYDNQTLCKIKIEYWDLDIENGDPDTKATFMADYEELLMK